VVRKSGVEVINPAWADSGPPEQVLGQRFFDLLPGLADYIPRPVSPRSAHGQEYVAHEQERVRLPYHRAANRP
jgi:hypothetical protein